MAANDPPGISQRISETVDTVKAYAKQEVVEPLKGVGKFLAFGAAGALLMAFGLVIGAIALLRVLQNETSTALTGNWSWVPYFAVLVVCGVIAVLALSRIKKGPAARPADQQKGPKK